MAPAPAPGAARLTVLGVAVSLRGDAAVVAQAAALLGDAAAPAADRPAGAEPAGAVEVAVVRDGHRYTVRRGQAVSCVDGRAGAVGHVLAAVNAAVLARARCLAVHAGVVARDGCAVAFPAPSGTGKSTLVAACLRSGWEYVSDEALCLDWSTGDVLPYPRPLGLSPWSRVAVGLPGPGGAEAFVTAGRFGAAVAAPPLRLAHVVLVDRCADVALDPLPRRDGVVALLTRSFNHWHDPARAFDLAHVLVARAGVWRLRLGDPLAAAALLGRALPPEDAEDAEDAEAAGRFVPGTGVAPTADTAGAVVGGQPGCRDTSDR